MQTIHIRNRKFTKLNLAELREYRELFWALAFRDFRIRYAQTAIGLVWAVMQPMITLLILTLVFDKFAQVDTGSVPHILFASSGMACWTYFSYVMTNSGGSIIMAQQMVKKIYFPRLIIPVSKAIVGLIDFAIVLGIIAVLMFYYGYAPNGNLVWLPVFVLINVMSALGIGIWLSALSVRYRDFQYVTPFLVQLGLYISPVAFPAEFALKYLPEWAAAIYYLNPAAGVIDGFRWSLLGLDTLNTYSWMSLISAFVIFGSGLLFFQRIENKIADIV